MKKIQAVSAPKLQKAALYPFALGYAVVVTIVTTGLLFKSDDLVDAIVRYNIGGGRLGVLMVALVAAAGVFALPYLLRMQVSRLMRVMSFLAAFAAPFGWLLAAWWIELHVGGVYGVLAIVVAHGSLLLALVSAWAIGLPFPLLKKRP